MVTISKPFASVLALALALGAASARAETAAATAAPQVMKPAHGVSLAVGTKKVAGYYMAGADTCDLTLMVADLPNADGQVASTATSTRMNVPVKAGTTQRVYTSDGKAIEASCAISTKLMTLRPLDQTALAVK